MVKRWLVLVIWSLLDYSNCILIFYRIDTECWIIVSVIFIWSLVTMMILPGKIHYGPPTRSNYRPKYCNSGWMFYLLSLSITVPLIWHYSVLHLYYKFSTFIGVLILWAVTLSMALFVKGHIAPDEGEHNSSGNPIFDYFCGIELYPHLLPSVNIKILFNSRFFHLLWNLIVLTAWKANYELRGQFNWQMSIVTILPTAYIAKSCFWEDGYMHSFDITSERLGFILTYGVFVHVPVFYTLPSTFLVVNSLPNEQLNVPIQVTSLVLFSVSLLATYKIDTQRIHTRLTDGQCTVWRRSPKLIKAKYRDEYGNEQSSLLLASGYWGFSRHPNYLSESVTFLAMALPTESILPHVLLLIIITTLVHRTFRDDNKCALKYQKYWNDYRQLVPYKIVPGIF